MDSDARYLVMRGDKIELISHKDEEISNPHSLDGALERAENAHEEWCMYKSMGERYLPVAEQHFSYMLMALDDVLHCLKKEAVTENEKAELTKFMQVVHGL